MPMSAKEIARARFELANVVAEQAVHVARSLEFNEVENGWYNEESKHYCTNPVGYGWVVSFEDQGKAEECPRGPRPHDPQDFTPFLDPSLWSGEQDCAIIIFMQEDQEAYIQLDLAPALAGRCAGALYVCDTFFSRFENAEELAEVLDRWSPV